MRWIAAIAGLVLLFALPAAAPAQGSWRTFTSDSGWTSFSHPAGWSVIPTDRSPSRYLENYAVQPARQDFTGRRGQVVIRIFDPMLVVEESRVATAGEYQFRRFVQALPGGARASISSRTVRGSRYFYARDTSENFTVDYAGYVNSRGYLNVVGLAAHYQEIEGWQTTLFDMLDGVRSPGPSSQLSGAEAAVYSWYAALKQGRTAAMMDMSCAKAQSAMALTWLGSAVLGGDAALATMSQSGRGFDFSGLRYQTMMARDGRAAVRVSGNVVGPDGVARPFHQFARNIGGSNSFFVVYERGGWRVCGPIRGGNR